MGCSTFPAPLANAGYKFVVVVMRRPPGNNEYASQAVAAAAATESSTLPVPESGHKSVNHFFPVVAATWHSNVNFPEKIRTALQ